MSKLEQLCSNDDLVWNRDYFVPLPTDDLQSCFRSPAGSEEMRMFELAVQDEMMVPYWDKYMEVWLESG